MHGVFTVLPTGPGAAAPTHCLRVVAPHVRRWHGRALAGLWQPVPPARQAPARGLPVQVPFLPLPHEFMAATALHHPAVPVLFEHLSNAVYLLDPETSVIVWGNHAVWESLGLTRDAVLHHSVLSLQKDVTGAPHRSEIAAVIRSTPCFTFVGRHRHALGHEVPVEANTTRFADQGHESEFELDGPLGRRTINWRLVPEVDDRAEVRSVLAICRDITGRKRARGRARAPPAPPGRAGRAAHGGAVGGQGGGQGGGRGGQPRQEQFPGPHEPRAAHADERHPGHDRAGAAPCARRGAARAARPRRPGLAAPAQPDQRHPGPVQDRSRAHDARRHAVPARQRDGWPAAAGRPPRRGKRPAADAGPGARVARPAAVRRPAAPEADPAEPGRQRDQVHRGRCRHRARPGRGRGSRRAAAALRGQRQRHRHRHRAGAAPPRVHGLRAGRAGSARGAARCAGRAARGARWRPRTPLCADPDGHAHAAHERHRRRARDPRAVAQPAHARRGADGQRLRRRPPALPGRRHGWGKPDEAGLLFDTVLQHLQRSAH